MSQVRLCIFVEENKKPTSKTTTRATPRDYDNNNKNSLLIFMVNFWMILITFMTIDCSETYSVKDANQSGSQ